VEFTPGKEGKNQINLYGFNTKERESFIQVWQNFQSQNFEGGGVG
jgi:hypothetical protein